MFDFKVNATPAVLNANFDQVSNQLDNLLERYEKLVIGPDDLKSAKGDMADLNKVVAEVKSLKKEKIDAVSGPIKEFDASIKKLIERILFARAMLEAQVKKYEDETKKKIEDALVFYADGVAAESGLRPEFYRVDLSDLIVLGSFTASEKLTKKAKESVEARVHACLSKQIKVDSRILQLENECYKAGLDTPLTKEHVEGFLTSGDDAYYADRLNQLIASELRRQESIKEKMEAKHREEIDEVKKQQPVPQAFPETPAPRSAPSSKAKEVRVVVVRFEVEVPVGTPDDRIIERVKDNIKGTKLFDHLHSMEVI